MSWVVDCGGGRPCGGPSWVRLPDTAPASFRAPMGGDRPLPMPPPGSRGVRRKQPRSAESMPVYVAGRGGPYYLEPSGPASLVTAPGGRLEGFAGDMIEGCGEKYEQVVGRNPTTGAPLNDPCRGSLGVAVFCGEADAQGWSQVLRGPAMGLVRPRHVAVRTMLADFPNDAQARNLVSQAGDWIGNANAAPTTSGPFVGQKTVDTITALIRQGACLASQLDVVIARMKAAGAKTRPVPEPPGGPTEPPSPGGLLGDLSTGAIAVAALAAVFLLAKR